MEVQIFGVKADAATRKALRFFSERRIKTHFVDLKQRTASRAELRRFLDRLGADRLVDRGSTRLQVLGLQTAHYGAGRWLEILVEQPLLLRMPLVRWQNHLTVGLDEGAWAEWAKEV